MPNRAVQTYRTNEQMMQAMKGATMALGSMNRTMNLPSLQRIAMEFERENDIMEQRQEMMDDAIDDAMDVGVEEEGDEVVEQVLEEIGVDLNQAVSCAKGGWTTWPGSRRTNKDPSSLGKPRRGYRPPPYLKGRLPRPLEAEVAAIQVMMTFRRDSTVSGARTSAISGKGPPIFHEAPSIGL